ncbi:Gfo/Idh/MocA family protein [Salinibacterium sp. M195]|uniref:Gfo/Idh/MocA family protein n=1 Tax=Salinibacterium sp. M195 TaxID=2583374 RepID=UPI001C625589|nr:Gfo/Idh/MocA family oxidoreductase [Salinibacterium sp. M195]QYH35078.1 Gfo/Idh/MocA family oxidoreductase [Salinibacterium sp. M195]
MTGIAIIGRGAMGATHARALASLGRAEQIKYVVARTAGGVAEAAPGASVISDFEVVLNDPEVDVVSICTPTGTHRELAVQALRAGKNVLLEKPIALTMDDGRAICDEAQRSGKVFMVAQVVRFFDGYRQLADDVAAGKLGRLVSARATRLSSKPDWADWLRDFAEAGGMLVDFGIHDFDQMNLLLGDPVEVSATGPSLTGARNATGPVETTITYRDGGIGQVLSYADLPSGAPFRSSVEVVGTGGFAQYEYAAESPVSPAVSRYSLSAVARDSRVSLAAEDPYARQLEYFLDCVAREAEPSFCPTPSALVALEVALAATTSLELGAPVRLDSDSASDPAAADA